MNVSKRAALFLAVASALLALAGGTELHAATGSDSGNADLNSQTAPAGDSAWWNDQMEAFKASIDLQAGSLEVMEMRVGGEYSEYEDEMQTEMGDGFRLASNSFELSHRGHLAVTDFKGEIDLDPEAGDGLESVSNNHKPTELYSKFLSEKGRYPNSVVELLSVALPAETWKSQTTERIRRVLLTFYNFNDGEFVNIQPEPGSAELGDFALRKLNEDQKAKWLELTSSDKVVGLDRDPADAEHWHTVMYGPGGEVYESYIYSRFID